VGMEVGTLLSSMHAPSTKKALAAMWEAAEFTHLIALCFG